jgi:DNA polymerase-3 subunit beta
MMSSTTDTLASLSDTTTFSFDVERSVLAKVLSHLQSIVEKKTTIPILSNVLLRLQNGQLSATATDLELDVIEAVPVLSHESGSTTVPIHTLYDIVRKLPDQAMMHFLCEDTHIKLTADRAKFSIPALPSSEYPTISQLAVKHTITLSSQALKTLLQKTRFCMSTLETRYALNGVYCHTVLQPDGQRTLRMVALDGHRLALADAVVNDCPDFEPFIIPKKAVNELCRLLEDQDTPVTLSLSNTKMSVAWDRLSLSTKLIDDAFPDYKQIVPKENTLALTVNTTSLKQAVDRVATMTTDKFNGISFNIQGQQIVINATSSAYREGTEEIACAFSGDDMAINFNARFLLDILSQMSGETTLFNIRDSMTPVVLRDAASEAALFVMMPLR